MKKALFPFLLGCLLLTGCNQGYAEDNCVFMNERTNLHNEYYVTAKNAYDLDNIEVLSDKNDKEKTTIYGTDSHFIAVDLILEHVDKDKPDDHKLDYDDFTLKDQTGFTFGNINIQSVHNGTALSNKDFADVRSTVDYSWNDKTIEPGGEINMTVYFKVPKHISTLDTIIVLEVDFFYTKTGTDIVLGNRPVNTDSHSSNESLA